MSTVTTRLATLAALALSLWAATPSFAATCSGGDNCRACKNCRYCKNCSQYGGWCSVCRPRKPASKAAPVRVKETPKRVTVSTAVDLEALADQYAPRPGKKTAVPIATGKDPEQAVFEFLMQYKRLRAETLAAWEETKSADFKGGYGVRAMLLLRSEDNQRLKYRLQGFSLRVARYNLDEIERRQQWKWKRNDLLRYICGATDALGHLLDVADSYLSQETEFYLTICENYLWTASLFDAEINKASP